MVHAVLFADRVLAGPDLSLIHHGAVIVDGETITWVGREADLSADLYGPDADLRRLGDVTLLPGLIDCHVHLAFDGGPAPVERMTAESDAAQVALMLRSARELLSVGVTTARDLGARNYLDVAVRDAIADGTARGPRLLTAGAPITVTGGHCWFMGGEADTADEVRRMVRRHHKMGVDVIKIMATGGFMTPGSAPWFAQFETEHLRAAVEEAHRVGKTVAAHAHGVDGIARSLAAGVDTLEHCSFVHADGRHEVVPELADRIAASDCYASPTCNFRLSELRALLPDQEFAIGELYRRGVKMIAGTDAGIDNTPHHGYVGGLVAMTEFGVPTREVLIAATTRAAAALGLSTVTGQLTAGYSADLIAVGGDPRHDIAALRDLRLVLSRGTPFVPDPLPAIEPLPADYVPAFVKPRPPVDAPPAVREPTG
ncbi:MAG: amidohydrolase family protein [Micromonosporaceae bacterium]